MKRKDYLSSIRQKSRDELVKELTLQEEALMKERFQLVGNRDSKANTGKVRELRRYLARIRTVLSQVRHSQVSDSVG